MGLTTMEEDGSTYPFIMEVKERSSETNFNGEIKWPTLNNAHTKFRGIIDRETIKFEEYEVIQVN